VLNYFARWRWLRRGLELPVRQRLHGRALRRLFQDCVHVRIKQRHLRTRNVIWAARWLPRNWLERLVGDFLTVKAFKPIQHQAVRLAA
jgi:hypothetical protein